jgi:hypothetical protein
MQLSNNLFAIQKTLIPYLPDLLSAPIGKPLGGGGELSGGGGKLSEGCEEFWAGSSWNI